MSNIDLSEVRRINLIRLMKRDNVIPARLAETIERDPPYIAAILSEPGTKGHRGIGKKILTLICEKTSWKEEEFYLNILGDDVPQKHNKLIPVISWVHAGLFADPVDVWPAGVSGIDDPVTSFASTSDNAFALVVEGDSMMPRYFPGDIVIVDPAIRCDNGSACVVWINGEVSLKLFWERGEDVLLKPMNDKYPEIVIKRDSKVDFKVIGKVVDMKAKL